MPTLEWIGKVGGGEAVYLLLNGSQDDRRVDGASVLSDPVLAALPRHDSLRVVCGERSRLGRARLKRDRIMFKQIPCGMRTT